MIMSKEETNRLERLGKQSAYYMDLQDVVPSENIASYYVTNYSDNYYDIENMEKFVTAACKSITTTKKRLSKKQQKNNRLHSDNNGIFSLKNRISLYIISTEIIAVGSVIISLF